MPWDAEGSGELCGLVGQQSARLSIKSLARPMNKYPSTLRYKFYRTTKGRDPEVQLVSAHGLLAYPGAIALGQAVCLLVGSLNASLVSCTPRFACYAWNSQPGFKVELGANYQSQTFNEEDTDPCVLWVLLRCVADGLNCSIIRDAQVTLTILSATLFRVAIRRSECGDATARSLEISYFVL